MRPSNQSKIFPFCLRLIYHDSSPVLSPPYFDYHRCEINCNPKWTTSFAHSYTTKFISSHPGKEEASAQNCFFDKIKNEKKNGRLKMIIIRDYCFAQFSVTQGPSINARSERSAFYISFYFILCWRYKWAIVKAGDHKYLSAEFKRFAALLRVFLLCQMTTLNRTEWILFHFVWWFQSIFISLR